LNVFVLNSGRCGSTTFIRACAHIDNFSAGHESRIQLSGANRLAYPEQHIEADNRLCWLLGRLDRRFGRAAYYVHLRRDPQAVIASFAGRGDFGIMRAWREGVLLGGAGQDPEELAADYLETVEANIELFLRDKPHRMQVRLETVHRDFARFWEWIGARGDRAAALAEWRVRYNASAD